MMSWKDELYDRRLWVQETVKTLQTYARILKLRNVSGLKKAEFIDLFQRLLFDELIPAHETALNKKIVPCTCSNRPLCHCLLRMVVSELDVAISSSSPKTASNPLSSPTSVVRPLPHPDTSSSVVRRLINDRSLWLSLKKDQLLSLRKSLMGSNGNSARKEELAHELIARCNEILVTYPERAGNEAFMRKYGGHPVELILNIDQLLVVQENKPAINIEFYSEDMTTLRDHLNSNNLSLKKDAVKSYRQGLDLYSELTVDVLDRPEVDHIIERQLVSYAMLSSGLDRHVCTNSGFFSPVKEVVNTVNNLNVTSRDINGSKGKAFTEYIKEERANGMPRPLPVIMNSDMRGRERAVGRFVDNVMRTIEATSDGVVQGIAQSRRSDNHVSSSRQYEDVADQLSRLLEKSGMHEYSSAGVKTRSQQQSAASTQEAGLK